MKKIAYNRLLITCIGLVFSSVFSFAQTNDMVIKQPKDFIVNGTIDSFGFFRFYNKDFLIGKYVWDVKEEVNGDFYFTKEMFDIERNEKFIVVFSFYEYSSFFPFYFDKSQTEIQIKNSFVKTDSLSKNDVWKIQNVVSKKSYNSINLFSEKDFFNRFLTKSGAIINCKDDEERLAVVLRLLTMNILVSVACVSGDLIIPTHKIGIPIW